MCSVLRVTAITGALWLAGCAWQSEVMQVGPDMYRVSANASPARGGVTGAQEMALSNASEKCASVGRVVLVKDTTTDFAFPANGVATITFTCVDENYLSKGWWESHSQTQANNSLERRLDKLEKEAREEREYRDFENQIRAKVPEYDEFMTDKGVEELNAFVEMQKPSLRRAYRLTIESGTAEEVVDLLNDFKAHKAKQAAN